nr:unnamed protein product [Callosobruchus chinensis]
MAQLPENGRGYYRKLSKLVTLSIRRHNSHIRECSSPHESLKATLWFMVTMSGYEALKFSAIFSPQALGRGNL